MKLRNRLARLEVEQGCKPNAQADADFARLADYFDTGGPDAVATIMALSERHPRKGA